MDYNEEETGLQEIEIEIVKKMIRRNDYVGARDKLLKVQHHFPALVNNISEMICVCDILCTADFNNKLSDYGTDWYQVLQVNPTARETQIQHQYRRITALLQQPPINNCFPGTASALKIIQDAFSVLSHPEKRPLFDLERATSLGAYESAVIFQKSFDDLGQISFQREYSSAPICKGGATCETLDGNGIHHHVCCPLQQFQFQFHTHQYAIPAPGRELEEEEVVHSAEISTGNELDPLAAIPDALKNMAQEETSENGISSEYSSLTHCPLFSPHTPESSIKFRWSAEHVASEQIWAVYDGPDSMPRRYVVVNNLISDNEACVTFLDPHPMLDDEIYWVEENLPFVVGLFRASTTTLNLSITHFSHLIDCDPSANKSFYKIYPKKGEVWAMYRNWNSRWKQSDFTHYRCEIVEIISDLIDKDSELKTASLVPLSGCMTFFRRQLSNEFELVRTVPRTEMLSFSHRIVAFTVPGIEKHGIPEGSLHLEPNALPLKFGMQF
ncbi:uncharacterized protein LOC132286882 [Cornus florida]|uniref:uncharacterized protein LOC132286882 n=1 Tax=Cornus florida TaxID=4283 RepID=UPI00289F409C|nr:uncharacterized protein LOC132286882 [Cornus florida]